MRIFKLNEEIETYTYPIIKIFVCAVIDILIFYRDKLFDCPQEPVVIVILVYIISVGCVSCVVISLEEIWSLHERRAEAKRDVAKLCTKKYTVDDILAMAVQEDVLEIEIKFDGRIVKVGSCSDSCPGRNDLFDKAYFCKVQKMELIESIEEFRERLEAYSTDGVLEVFSIDDLPVVEKKKKRANKD